jgi:hypothetical protein
MLYLLYLGYQSDIQGLSLVTMGHFSRCSIPIWSCELLYNLIMDTLQKLEEPDLSASVVPAVTEVL